MKNEIKIFDPPMCCSSGVCGTTVNPELVRFAGDLEFLKKNGVAVQRFNLSSEPAAFVAEPLVKETLAKEGNDCLPLTIINGEVAGKGSYPAREDLLKRIGLSLAETASEELAAFAVETLSAPKAASPFAEANKESPTLNALSELNSVADA